MTTFLDGPAQGVILRLRRAPMWLRVVQGPESPTLAGGFDALDQLDDEPTVAETVYVYRMVEGPWSMHVNRRGGCAWYQGGKYQFVQPQPEQDQVRSRAAWRAWVAEQVGQPLADNGAMLTEVQP